MARRTKDDVRDLTAEAVLQLARLGRVTDETYDALKAAVTPDDDDQADDDADKGDDDADSKTDDTDTTGARKASTARKASR